MYTGKENPFDLEIIAAASDSRHQDSEKLRVDVKRLINFNGDSWTYQASPLEIPWSLHTKIGLSDNKGNIRYDSWLDWHDMKTNPGIVRSLIYIGANQDISLEEKLQRVESLSQSIQAYDTIMNDYNPNSSKKELEDLLSSGKLPRPQIIQLVWSASDGGLGLNYVAKKLGFKLPDDRLEGEWKYLVELCETGKLIKTWQDLVTNGLGKEILFKEPEIVDPNKPERFYKDDLCIALTGHTEDELQNIVHKNIVNPIREQMWSISADAPRDVSDKVVDNHLIFMNTEIVTELLSIPIEELYETVIKFKKFEQYVHPANSAWSQREYYNPTYEKIERAYLANNEVVFKDGLLDLIDKILHD